MKKNLNQKLINLIEYYNLVDTNLLLSNTPLKRNQKDISIAVGKTRFEKLKQLKKIFNL